MRHDLQEECVAPPPWRQGSPSARPEALHCGVPGQNQRVSRARYGFQFSWLNQVDGKFLGSLGDIRLILQQNMQSLFSCLSIN